MRTHEITRLKFTGLIFLKPERMIHLFIDLIQGVPASLVSHLLNWELSFHLCVIISSFISK